MNSEDYIRKKLGKRNPFSVPEGYFGSLSSEVMARLPERHVPDNTDSDCAVFSDRQNKHMRILRPILYAAASAVICVFGAYAYLTSNAGSQESAVHMKEAGAIVSGTEAYTNAVADYAMMDNTDIYAYLYDE